MVSQTVGRAASGLRNVNGALSIDPGYALVQTLPFSSTISWNASLGTNINISCTSNTNFTLAFPTGLKAGMRGIIYISQWTTGGQLITWPGGYRGLAGVVPVLTTDDNGVDEIEWYSPDGFNVDLILHANFVSGVTQNGQLDFSTGNNSSYIAAVL